LNNDRELEAAVGLRAKTGRAIAVVVTGPVESPRALLRTEIALTDPAAPATGQPYHEVLDLPWAEAKSAVQKTVGLIEAAASTALAELLNDLRKNSIKIRSAGIVGAGNRNLEKIGSPHIRAHAAEGVVFRHALEVAAERNGLASTAFPERGLEEIAPGEIGLSAADLNRVLAEMGRSVGRPWRADEKAAAIGGWLALKMRRPRR
jgi:hypothetical protein